MTPEANDDRRHVAQASSPASSGTVPVPGNIGSGSETPPELARETPALHDAPNPLVAGFHFRGTLPHLKKERGTYFVTFRQAGSLPKEVLLRFKQEREAILQHAVAAKRPLTWHEEQELFQWYSSRVDKYLDAGQGTCYLRDPKLAELVATAIQFFRGQRYELHAWAVMPNRVHAVVWPMPGRSLTEILHSWKSFTAHQINKLLPQKTVPFWQTESYEHLVRDDEDLHRCCHYVLMNPVNAKLCSDPAEWKWSSGYVQKATTNH
jgi:REP element-mobilizing transposase RayT